MAEIFDFNVLADNNNQAPPNGFPEGQTPSSLNNGIRELMAALARHYETINGSVVTTGTDNAYEISVNQTIASITAGLSFTFRTNRDSGDGAATLNVNSLGAINLTTAGSATLPSRALINGGVYTATYDGTNFVLNSMGIPPPTNLIHIPYQGSADQYVTNWTKPAGLRRLRVIATAGGGGGEIFIGTNNGGSGASSATEDVLYEASDLPDTVEIRIGRAGSGGVFLPSYVSPANGNNTTFGSLITVNGGGRAGDGTAPNAFLPGTAQGTTVAASPTPVARVTYEGRNGESKDITDATGQVSTRGGDSIYGGGGILTLSNTVIRSTGEGRLYGGGGAGGFNAAAPAGYIGSHGIVRLEEYF